MRETIRLSLILTVICALTGAALAVTYAQTRPIIEEREAQALQENLQTLLPAAESFEAQGKGKTRSSIKATRGRKRWVSSPSLTREAMAAISG